MSNSEEKERAYYLARVQFWQKMFWPFLISWSVFAVLVLGSCGLMFYRLLETMGKGC